LRGVSEDVVVEIGEGEKEDYGGKRGLNAWIWVGGLRSGNGKIGEGD
jgi:hypothetical protein